ncbi:Nitrogen assimilation transcription factor nit-4 [Teratosphaeria destructans]|uniref:Nitrogen assimilation transcription factor nit-4 n=1 Tax=Teratosphaeria destructans TaxID=418781 RepID=A0A9W7VZM6_9PEZI|nr:Nitrogen assimilation transcription factor nit-4 [Teratosphaeria destructans]
MSPRPVRPKNPRMAPKDLTNLMPLPPAQVINEKLYHPRVSEGLEAVWSVALIDQFQAYRVENVKARFVSTMTAKWLPCDADLPSCSTCMTVYNTKCFYDADSDHRRKGALERDIQTLQERNDCLDVIVASLRSLPENEAITLLHNLRTEDADPRMLARSLKSNVQLPTSFGQQTLEAEFAQQLSQAGYASLACDTVTPVSALSRHESIDSTYAKSVTSSDHTAAWFRTPQDAEFVEQLLNLYFSWIHPWYHILSREHFLQDMSRGGMEHCSAILVNAILSFACHYSDRPAARDECFASYTAGDQFFAEAKRLLDIEEKPCLTNVQALRIMACLRRIDLWDDAFASLLELGLHFSVTDSGLRSTEVEVRRITFWGVTCAVAFRRVSQLPRAAADVQKPSVSERLDLLPWNPYEDPPLTANPAAEQPSRLFAFMNFYSRLSELSSDIVNTFYAPRKRFTSRRLYAAYAQYQEWYRSLPSFFQLENTCLPYALVLHMSHCACVLHLFRPYIKLDLSGAGLYPRDTCIHCANEISVLMNALRRIEGLHRVPLPVTSILLSASTIHLLNLPSEPATLHLTQALQDLQAIAVNHRFAGRCIDIIRSLAARWEISLPGSLVPGSALGISTFTKWSCPPANFAPFIPRHQSSGASSGTQSEESTANGPGPFPPQPLPHPHLSSFYSEESTPAEQQQIYAQSNFWTPFPLQTGLFGQA